MKMESITTAQSLLLGVSSDTQVLYNNGGVIGGTDYLTLNDATGVTTATGLTVTNCAVLGSNSAVFQPLADSTTFFQVKNAAGTGVVFNANTTNRRVGINTAAPATQFQITADDAATGVGQFKIVSDASNTGLEIEVEYESGRSGLSNYLTAAGSVFQILSNNATGGGAIKLQSDASGPQIQFGQTNDTDYYGVYGTFGNVLAFWAYGRPVQFKAGTNGGTMYTILQGDNSTGFVGLAGEESPETAVEITNALPYITTQNSTHENTDGGRESRWIGKGNKTDETEHTLGIAEWGHDGTADDFGGYFKISTHTKAEAGADTLVDALTIDSAQLLTSTGGMEIIKTTTPQLRLAHTDGVDETDFYTNSDGQLIVMPTSRTMYLGDGTDGDGEFGFYSDTSLYTLHHDEDNSLLRVSANDATNYTQFGSDGTIDFAGTSGMVLPHLQQSDSTDQAISDVTDEQVITFNSDDHHAGITRTSSSRFTITKAASYLITFSAVVKSTVAGKNMVIWLKKNGSNVADTSTYYTFKSANANTIITVTYIEHFAVDDYFELWMWGDSTGVKLEATSAVSYSEGVTPAIPACPSIIMTCNYVGKD